MRSYTFRHSSFFGGLGSIKIFVVYHEGVDGRSLQHSLGMQKGLTGVVHAFALLATECPEQCYYCPRTLAYSRCQSTSTTVNGLPVYPEGFSEQGDGRIILNMRQKSWRAAERSSPDKAVIPGGLDECVVGYKTAYEIGW